MIITQKDMGSGGLCGAVCILLEVGRRREHFIIIKYKYLIAFNMLKNPRQTLFQQRGIIFCGLSYSSDGKEKTR